jgi:hypothetical protein
MIEAEIWWHNNAYNSVYMGTKSAWQAYYINSHGFYMMNRLKYKTELELQILNDY